jgi:hypothetical protein
LADALLETGAASNVWEALAMPAHLAVEMIAARQRRMSREGAAGAGREEAAPDHLAEMPGGGRTFKIRSEQGLSDLLGGKLT